MPKLKKIIEQINKDNAPPDGWRPKDAVSHSKKQDKPEAGKTVCIDWGARAASALQTAIHGRSPWSAKR